MNPRFLIIALLVICGCSTNLIDSARIYERKGDYSAAIKCYEKAASLESGKIERLPVYMEIARIYASTGQFAAAEKWFRNALHMISDLPEESVQKILLNIEIQYCRALSAIENGDYVSSIAILEDMLLVENTPDIHYYLSVAYGRQARSYSLQGTASSHEGMRPISPEFSEASDLINQGCELARSSSVAPGEARTHFELAIRAVPENPQAQNIYEEALLLLRKKEYTRAVDLLSQMVSTPDVFYYLVKACYEQSSIHAQKATQWLMEEKERELQTNVMILYDDALEAIEADPWNPLFP